MGGVSRSASLGPVGGPKPLLPAAIKYLVVHCSATPPNQDIGRAEIDRMHRLRGFDMVGYHFLIRRNGVIEDGRPMDRIGAHVENFNHCSLGICLIGGVDSKLKPEANFTPEQLVSLKTLLPMLKDKLPNPVVVQGHRDFPNVAKACPSFDVATWLKSGHITP